MDLRERRAPGRTPVRADLRRSRRAESSPRRDAGARLVVVVPAPRARRPTGRRPYVPCVLAARWLLLVRAARGAPSPIVTLFLPEKSGNSSSPAPLVLKRRSADARGARTPRPPAGNGAPSALRTNSEDDFLPQKIASCACRLRLCLGPTPQPPPHRPSGLALKFALRSEEESHDPWCSFGGRYAGAPGRRSGERRRARARARVRLADARRAALRRRPAGGSSWPC